MMLDGQRVLFFKEKHGDYLCAFPGTNRYFLEVQKVDVLMGRMAAVVGLPTSVYTGQVHRDYLSGHCTNVNWIDVPVEWLMSLLPDEQMYTPLAAPRMPQNETIGRSGNGTL